jgi:glucose-6-phosphate isomerase
VSLDYSGALTEGLGDQGLREDEPQELASRLASLDPDRLSGLRDSLQLRRTVFNVISKSGSGAQTLAPFLFVYPAPLEKYRLS